MTKKPRSRLSSAKSRLKKHVDEPWKRWFYLAIVASFLVTMVLLRNQKTDLLVIVGGLSALAIGIIAMKAPQSSWMREIAPELIGISIGVMAIDQLYQIRLEQQQKQTVISQLGSRSNEFALEAARIARVKGWHQDGSLEGAELWRANLAGVYLGNTSLRGANLSYANLEGAMLPGASLKDANLIYANLKDATLAYANLENADLHRANLADAYLENTSLRGANLSYANLEGAILTYASLEGANITNASYNDETQWPDGFNYGTSGAVNTSVSPSQAD